MNRFGAFLLVLGAAGLALPAAGQPLAGGHHAGGHPESAAGGGLDPALRAEMGGQTLAMALVDRFEYQSNEGDGLWLWDAQGWYGGDIHKLWIKTEGEYLAAGGGLEEAELQALYSRAISPFFDLQLGYRIDLEPDPERHFAVLGVQGLAPQWFEVDAAAFVSDEGDISARLEAEYDLLLTQRLILQPRAELDVAVQDVSGYGVGSGLGRVAAELRLRYEIRREFAPYVGISWRRKLGDTADFAREAGEDVGVLSLVAGVRLWF